MTLTMIMSRDKKSFYNRDGSALCQSHKIYLDLTRNVRINERPHVTERNRSLRFATVAFQELKRLALVDENQLD